MRRDAFRARLQEAPLVCDGAMGTALYAKGVMVNRCFDELNLSNPELVRSVHSDYLAVGVDILETNTYGANRFKLKPHGFADRVHDVNLQGAAIARDGLSNAGGSILVAGAIGPLGKPIAPIGTISEAEAYEAFREQAEGLAAGGCDLFLLETFSDLRELSIAVRAARSLSTTTPIVAQMTFGDDGATPLGAKPERVARKLTELDVDGIGANCSVGPELMLRVIEQLRMVTALPLSVQPNAGLPEVVEGRVIYLSSPEYMAHYAKRFLRAGAAILGGCCGTTPAHIGAMVGVVRALGPARASVENGARDLGDGRSTSVICGDWPTMWERFLAIAVEGRLLRQSTISTVTGPVTLARQAKRCSPGSTPQISSSVISSSSLAPARLGFGSLRERLLESHQARSRLRRRPPVVLGAFDGDGPTRRKHCRILQ